MYLQVEKVKRKGHSTQSKLSLTRLSELFQVRFCDPPSLVVFMLPDQKNKIKQ